MVSGPNAEARMAHTDAAPETGQPHHHSTGTRAPEAGAVSACPHSPTEAASPAGGQPGQEPGSKLTFITLLYVAALTITSLYAPQPLLSSIHTDYPALGKPTVALLMAVCMLPLSIAPLVYGFYLRTLQTRMVLVVGVCMLIVADLGLFVCTHFWGLVALRLLQGLSIPALLTCLMASISNHYKGAELQRAMAIYIAVTILGGVVGRLAMGIVASWLGWRHAFLAASLALILALVPLWLLPARGNSRHMSHVRFGDFFVIMRTPGMLKLLGIESCVMFLYGAISNYLPFHLSGAEQGVSEWRIALMYTGNMLGVFIALGSHWIIARFGSETRVIGAGLCIILAGLPILFCANLWIIFAAMCVVSVGQFLIHGICPGLINRLKSADKGAVNGVYLSCYYAGSAIGAYGPGFVYAQWGWGVLVSMLMGILLLMGLACTHRLGESISRGM